MFNKILEHFLEIKKRLYIGFISQSIPSVTIVLFQREPWKKFLEFVESRPPMQANFCRQILVMGLP